MTAFPTPMPSRSMSQDDFNLSIEATYNHMPTFEANMNAADASVAANASTASAAATTATTKASEAAASAQSANGAAGAVKWVSGTTYAEGAVVWSPINFSSYRRKIAGGGTTDPSIDTTNWGPLYSNIAATASTGYAVVTSGNGAGVNITNTNSTSAYQHRIAGEMTSDLPTNQPLAIETNITGGASSISLRGQLINTTYTPVANASIYNLYNQSTLNSGISPAVYTANYAASILGANALGGTIPTAIGYNVNLSINAAATTNITTWIGYYATGVVNGALQTITNVRSFFGNQSAGPNYRNCYMPGTAINYFNGAVMIGSDTDDTVNKLQVTGSAKISNGLDISGGVIDLPSYITGTRPTAAASNIIYDSTLNKVCVGTAVGTWETIGLIKKAPVTLSGTGINLSNAIDAGANKITIAIAGLTTNGTSAPVLQLADAGGIESTGYNGCTVYNYAGSSAILSDKIGFQLSSSWAAIDAFSGIITLVRTSGNQWILNSNLYSEGSGVAAICTCGGAKTLTGELTTIYLRTTNGIDVFDGGTVTVQVEM